jgi:uncharacterized protein YPO0396
LLLLQEALIAQTLQLASIDVRAIKKQKKEDRKAAESRLYGRSKGLSTLRRALTADEVRVGVIGRQMCNESQCVAPRTVKRHMFVSR